MPRTLGEVFAKSILADLFGNSTHLSSPPGSAQRQRIKNDYRDWQKTVALLFSGRIALALLRAVLYIMGGEKQG
ncbi:hypothetical protein EG329_012130 [Mollisiaceae sp. DMI_Dod_QoI]|nr:hypothetical protein EG329_012130 [Helotiales sp. DMI_Dod_QoI]